MCLPLKRIRLGLLITASFASTLAFARVGSDNNVETGMSALFDGPPQHSEGLLHSSAYVPEKLQKLSHARIAYINWEAVEDEMKSMGMGSLPRVLTPQLAKAILDRAGFAKHLNGESIEAYTQEFMNVYSIRYGGRWINFNFGSGRNGATGRVDRKGIGRTQLVRPWADSGHSSGGLGVTEAIKEAIWSNILHASLPSGANRVLFVITTGTPIDTKRPDEDRAILVRQDPVRPAYFQPNAGVWHEDMPEELRAYHQTGDAERMRNLVPGKLLQALPLPKGKYFSSQAQKLTAGLYEMANRIAQAYALGYTKQFVMAGATTSNVEIDGRALDFGTTTAVVGYPSVHLLPGESPNGSTVTLKNEVVVEFVQELRDVVPPELRAAIPNDEAMATYLETRFNHHMALGFLELVGTPKEYSASFLNGGAGPAKDLADMIVFLAQAGNTKVLSWRHENMPRSGPYNVERILNALVTDNTGGLAAALRDDALREKLTTAFAAYRLQLQAKARADGISPQALATYMKLATKARNRALYQVRSGKHFFAEIKAAADAFGKAGHPEAIQDFINATVARNTREYKAPPFQLIINDTDPNLLKRGLDRRLVFDLKTGAKNVVTTSLPGFNQKRMSDCERRLAP